MTQAEQVTALRELLTAMYDVIVAHGARGVPAGEMFCRLTPATPSMTAQQFNTLVSLLVQTGRVKRSNHLLVAM